MLNAIIQGNKKDNLIRLGNPLFNENSNNNNISFDEENINNIDNNSNDSVSMEITFCNENKELGISQINLQEKNKMKKHIYLKQKIKKDPFSCFLRGMVDFVFSDNYDSKIIYQLRNELMQFFTSILEEKNCNEELHKLIIRHFSTHRVFNSISSILKNYILSKINSDSLPKDFFIRNNLNSIENILIQQLSMTMKTLNKYKDNEAKQNKKNNNNEKNDFNINI
jgi:hypothetical protein